MHCYDSYVENGGDYHISRLQCGGGKEMYVGPRATRCIINTNLIILGFPVSLLLVGMIYTGTKALQYLSIPVFTIFKNLTIIITAYGEVLWFGGSVTRLTLFSFGLIVLSSVVAAWADIQHALHFDGHTSTEASAKISTLNAGYMWMLFNCFCTSTYVLGMRKRIKLTNFKDFDSTSHSALLIQNLSSTVR